MHIIQTLPAWTRYLVIALLACFVIAGDSLLDYGKMGSALFALSMGALVALMITLLVLDCRAKNNIILANVMLVALAIGLLLGEYGASTSSKISFAISLWKLSTVAIAVPLLAWDARNGFAVLRRLRGSRVSMLFVVFAGIVLLAVAVQLLLGMPDQVKGSVRALTFYPCLLLAFFSLAVLLVSDARLSLLKNVMRTALFLFLTFSLVEMVTGFHLPTSWLLSDDPETLALLASVLERDPSWKWVTASGFFFNTNNHCLFLAILAALSLPSARESKRAYIGSVLLALATLLVTSMLGSTLVSIGLLLMLLVWSAFTNSPIAVRVAVSLLAIACMFILADLALSLLTMLAGSEVGAAAPAMEDFGIQFENYEQSSGSMWMRLAMYSDLLRVVVTNPLGVGAGELQSYFIVNPSASGLVDPHNWWFEFAACYGWAPLAALVAVFIAVAWVSFRDAKRYGFDEAAVIVPGIFVSAVGSLAPSSCEYNVLVWLPILVGLTLHVNKLEMMRRRENENTARNV